MKLNESENPSPAGKDKIEKKEKERKEMMRNGDKTRRAADGRHIGI